MSLVIARKQAIYCSIFDCTIFSFSKIVNMWTCFISAHNTFFFIVIFFYLASIFPLPPIFQLTFFLSPWSSSFFSALKLSNFKLCLKNSHFSTLFFTFTLEKQKHPSLLLQCSVLMRHTYTHSKSNLSTEHLCALLNCRFIDGNGKAVGCSSNRCNAIQIG